MLLDKCFIKRYIKFNFLDKKILITKLIILFGVIILELIMIIPTYLAVANMPNSTVGKESDFLHILVITNTGVSFSFLQNAPIWFVNCLQLFISLLVLIVFLLFHDKKHFLIPIAIIFFAGFFNFIDRNINFTLNYNDQTIVKKNAVLDYFQFSFSWFSAVFNLPDIFISCSVAYIAIAFIWSFFHHEQIVVSDYRIGKETNLFIDCSQKNLYLALIQNERACVKYTIPTNNNLTDISIAHLQKLFKHVYAYPTDVQILYTTNGPGSSFTGCRIATILAQVFLLVNNVSVKTISTLLLQANVPNCLSLLDARNEHRYYGVIKNNKLIKDGLIKQNEVDKLLKDNVLKDVVCDYQNVDIYECVCKHLSDFSSGIKFPNYLKGISTTI